MAQNIKDRFHSDECLIRGVCNTSAGAYLVNVHTYKQCQKTLKKHYFLSFLPLFFVFSPKLTGRPAAWATLWCILLLARVPAFTRARFRLIRVPPVIPTLQTISLPMVLTPLKILLPGQGRCGGLQPTIQAIPGAI